MTTIAVLPAVVEKTFSARVRAWERRLSGPRRTWAAAQLLKKRSTAVPFVRLQDRIRFNVDRCGLGELRTCICLAFNGSAGERSAVVAQIAV